MTMQYSLTVKRSPIYPDGTSNSVTVDFTEDLKKVHTFGNNSPSGLGVIFCDAHDENNAPIGFTAVRQGRSVKFKFESVPPLTTRNTNPPPDLIPSLNPFTVQVEFLYPSD